jgi:hypothetical protein
MSEWLVGNESRWEVSNRSSGIGSRGFCVSTPSMSGRGKWSRRCWAVVIKSKAIASSYALAVGTKGW